MTIKMLRLCRNNFYCSHRTEKLQDRPLYDLKRYLTDIETCIGVKRFSFLFYSFSCYRSSFLTCDLKEGVETRFEVRTDQDGDAPAVETKVVKAKLLVVLTVFGRECASWWWAMSLGISV